MLEGTGLIKASSAFPERTYDVGIAEQHAVTFAAGLACEGIRPVVAIYSTFLQRAYDQIIHDVALQNLPVTFALDRGGLVGADGKTHQGAFDLSYLRCIPNLVVMAPSDENELRHMLHTALAHDGPAALPLPARRGRGRAARAAAEVLEIGKGRVVRAGAGKPDVCVVAIGRPCGPAVAAAEALAAAGLAVSGRRRALREAARRGARRRRGGAGGPGRHRGGERLAGGFGSACSRPSSGAASSPTGSWCAGSASRTSSSPTATRRSSAPSSGSTRTASRAPAASSRRRR